MIKRTLLLACAVLLVLAGGAQAQSVTMDGIEYTVNSDGQTVTVTDADNSTKAATIPATVNIEGTDYPVTDIGYEAFYDCAALQSITLPEGLQTINGNAFYHCDALQSITLPSTLQIIGGSAFSLCISLQSITFSEGLKTIGSMAFIGCDALQNVTLPEGLQSIGGSAFVECGSLQSVILPSTLQTISNGAFAGCYALQSVTFPEGIQIISDKAFQYCDALQDITLPSTLQAIGELAFEDCGIAEIISLAVTPPSIHENTFSGHNATVVITVPKESETAYRTARGWKDLFHYPKIGGVQYYVDFATQEAFVTDADGSILRASIPATIAYEGAEYPVTTISDEAFYECESLQSVILPESLQIIGNDAFFGCLLKDIACLAATPPSIEENSFNVETYATATFTVPQGTEAAYRAAKGWRLFYTTVLNAGIMYRVSEDGQTVAAIDADNYIVTANVLATVNIKGVDYLVTSIGDNAFKDCTLLQSVTLPEGLQTIGDSSFYNCNALQSVAFPEGLQIISDAAFQYCDALQSITLPKGLQTIGDMAFFSCDALRSITLPEGLQTINNNAFGNCLLMEIICLSTTPPAIRRSTFDPDTYANATLTVPKGTEAVYQVAEWWKDFFHYPNIDGLQYYVDFATQEAFVTDADGSILKASIPATIAYEGTEYPVTTISDEAFYECESLQSVILPESLQIIGNDAFFGCLLKDITCLAATPPSIEENSFNVETYTTATLTVPQGTEAAYRAAKGWRLFYTTVLNAGIMYRVSEDGQTVAAIDADNYIVTANVLATVNIKGVDYLVTSIGDNAFKDCTLLQSVTLPEGLQTIGDSSFYNCNALQSINIPQGVTEIKSRAFSNCSALQSINIPQGITTIGYSAFSNCSALQSINIPQGVMEIGLWTFNGCTSLQSVALPEGLQTIGYSAFSNCSALQSINIPQGVTEINLGAFLHCPLRDIICLATIPPTIELHSFDAETYETATLHVPSDAVADYQAAQYWEQFLHIESSLPPVSISSVAADASLARYANGILTTSAPAAITVYAQSGARVLHAADATSLSLEGLPRGIYIICVAQGRQRQVMKVVR